MKTTLYSFRGYLVVPIVALVTAFALGACDSLVETEPLGQLTSENFFETPDHAVQATNATYNMLRDWPVHVFAWIGMTDIVSDDATKGSTPADASFLLELDNLTFDPGNIAFGDTWGGYYRGIYRANVAIQGIPGIEMDETLKNRLIGENKFLRAYYYFFLVRAYGGVPLVTAPLAPSEYQQQRATEEEVYNQIVQDLTDAIAVLPERSGYSGADQGRATKGAAHALLAKVYLFRGDYAGALAQAQAVINSGQYSLYPAYATIFTDAGENSSESVFEVQAVALEQGGGGSQYAQVQGVRGEPNVGWGFNQPSDNLEAAFEPGDPRLEATILFPWELTPDNAGTVVIANQQMTNQRYNQKVYVSPETPGGTGNAGTNIRRIRYADVLLIAAEAAYRTNNEALARQYLNDVRRRARGNQQSTLGFSPEALAPQIAQGNLGLGSGTSRVFARYVDPAGSGYTAGLRSFSSQIFDYTDNSLVPVLVENMDLITSVNGTTVTTLQGFLDAMRTIAPGQNVTLGVLRVTQTGAGGTATTATTPMTLQVTAQALLPDVTVGGQALLDAIWHERRVELAMEQHRWFDLIRTGQAPAAMQAIGKTFVVGKHEKFPIPQREVDLMGLTQNPGYQ